jgi:outer membrane protein assembly factor BamB
MNTLLALILAATIAGWRTDGTGRYPDAQPVTEFSTEQNVVWHTPLPKWSNASVVLSGDRLFTGAEPATLVCLNAADGKVLWERANTYADAFPAEAAKIREAQRQTEPMQTELRDLEKQLRGIKKKRKDAPDDKDLAAQETGATEKIEDLKKRLAAFDQWRMPQAHDANGFSSPTPVTDGQSVYALFGNGVAACYDRDGHRQWIQLVEKPTAGWGQSSSPALVAGKLVVLINALYALDAKTGAPAWRAASKQRWGSPVAARVGELDVIVTPAGEIVRARDGEVLVTGLGALDYNVPLVQDSVAYFIQHAGKAVKLIPAGDNVKTEVLWTTHPKNDRYYSSPVLLDGLLYAVNQKGDFSVIDAATGAVVHERKLALEGTAYPSVTLAGKYLVIGSEGGTTLVLEPGREPRLIATNRLPRYRSSPVFAGQRMYLRTLEGVLCAGK